MLETLLHDVRYAIRVLARARAFTVAALLTLAIGIGANTAVFNAIHALLLEELPFGHAEQLCVISPSGTSVSKSFLVDLRSVQRAFEGVTAFSGWGFAVTGLGEPLNVSGARVTPDFFDVLQLRPMMGRTFVSRDENVAIVSYDFWQAHLGGRALDGRTVTVDGTSRDVIAVLPPDVRFPARRTDIWLPISISPADSDYRSGYLSMVGRLRPGVSRSQALADLHSVAQRMARQSSRLPRDFGSKATVEGLRESITEGLRPTLFLLLAAVALVLFVACMNVANLTLSRYAGRESEMAIRAAIGAGRMALVRQVMVESIVLAMAGGVASLFVAFWCGRLIDRGLGTEFPLSLARSSMSMLLFAFGASLAAGVVCGLVPAVRLARTNFVALREIGRGSTEGRARRRVRTTMIAAQVALSLVLLTSAGLVLRSFWHIVNVNPGFVTGGLLTAEINPPDAVYGDDAPDRLLIRRVIEHVEALPGVNAAGAIQVMPFSGNNWNPSLAVDGRAVPEAAEPEVDWRVVTPRYFAAMQIPIIRGRAFTDTDDEHAPGVAIVSQVLALRVFPGEDPIGKRIRTGIEGKEWVTIVGVAGSMKDQTLTDRVRPQIFRPHAQHPVSSMVLMVRAATGVDSLRKAVPKAIWSIDPQIPVTVAAMNEVIGTSLSRSRLFLIMLLAFAAIAIFLSAVGIYGVTFDAVAQRTREIGIRLALGGNARDILLLVLKDVIVVAGAGTLAGLAGARIATGLLTAHLYDISPNDLPTFVAVVVLLSAVAIAAAWFPARRASRLDPVQALRHK
jgi:putative ABC transport system permease protein